ncbi:MAG: hypothetical protein ORN58_01025, partial [Sediminibacterium sp.]|nr:hypothetical protein [Sediminibacterium sp.]
IIRVTNNVESNIKTYFKYDWYKDNTIVNGISSYVLASPSTGVYTVKGYNNNLCPSDLSKKYYYAQSCLTPTGRLGNGAYIQSNIINNGNIIAIQWCTEILKNRVTIIAIDLYGNTIFEQHVNASAGSYNLTKSSIAGKNYFIHVLDEKGEIIQISDVVQE